MTKLVVADLGKSIKHLNAGLEREEIKDDVYVKRELEGIMKELVEIREILKKKEREERLLRDVVSTMSLMGMFENEKMK